LKELQGQVPCAKIGDTAFSRVILGGNLIGGWAHARDLLYVDKLVKMYHTKEKVFETYVLAEKCGINAALLDVSCLTFCIEYKKRNLGGLHIIAQCPRRNAKTSEDFLKSFRAAVDSGVSACYVQGVEQFLDKKDYDHVANALEFVRQNGLPAGIGSHHIDAIKECIELGLVPDFWMKTLHHHNYWSAMPAQERKDNVYCEDSEETIEYMKTLEQPWIAFKILAAGAIPAKDGLHYAFQNGADFACVGMYDFQVVENANLTCEILASDLSRQRPWRAIV